MRQVTSCVPQVNVIIVNWNGHHHLRDGLPSVLQTRWAALQVSVFDNGSIDGSQQLVAECFPQVQLVELGHNLGFTGANNIGMQRAIHANADYVVLLNNDTRVEPDWLSHLVEVAESDSTIAACSSRQLTWDGDQEIKQVFYPQIAAGDNVIVPISSDNQPAPSPYADGCCMLLRVGALKQIGLFDPRYFAYAEDLDLSLRAWMAGFQVLHVPDSIIYHRIGGSPSAQRAFWGYRNQLTTMLKNYEWRTMSTYKAAVLSRWFVTRYRVAWRATASAFFMLPGTAARRRRIQTQRVRSDREVFERMGIAVEGI